MSDGAKHRGWLLVYELQFWVILALSLFGSIGVALSQGPAAGATGAAVAIVFWGALIASLYGSTDTIRSVHIVANWLFVVLSLLNFLDHPTAVTTAGRYGEYAGISAGAALFVAWALYWHRSTRVQKAYPSR